jgi:hypothetical protein
MCATLGYPSQQLIGTDMMLLLAQGDAKKTRALRQQFSDKRYAIAQGVWQLRAASGCYLPLLVLGSWITKREGSLFKLVVMVHEACAPEGNAVLERHILSDDTLSGDTLNHPINTTTPLTDDAVDGVVDSVFDSNIADAWPLPKTPPAAPDNQRLRQRVVMLEGQLSAYKAALERYKVPAGIRFEEGAWYIQLPEVDDTPTETPSDED